MLLDPRTPIVIGTILIAVVVGMLAFYSPMPGNLSSPHGQIDGLSELEGCVTCHDEAGIAQGCLNCHEDIAAQLTESKGYHHFLLAGKKTECASCHSEHFGGDFQLINKVAWGGQVPKVFRHPHVEFTLGGKHDMLRCQDCHRDKLEEPVKLPRFENFAREHTFLNLDQDCKACHDDIHTDGLSGTCDACHGQDAFSPTEFFDHSLFLSLEDAHDDLHCSECHILPKAENRSKSRTPKSSSKPESFPFDRVQGKLCKECHDSPHLTALPGACDDCHKESERLWTSASAMMTPDIHAHTGFRLRGPHASVACAECHKPELDYRERHPDPKAPNYLRKEKTCQGCHEDVHRGQFLDKKHRCLDCHRSDSFHPTTFGHERHAKIYPLTGAHEAVACLECHQPDPTTRARKFVGTSNECKVCHKNPHGNQFDGHLGNGDCSICHSTKDFAIRPFAHEKRTGYRLKGAHAKADCNGCHIEALVFDGVPTRRYRGTPRDCVSCHEDYHRGQFDDKYGSDCSFCHKSQSNWKKIRFNHNKHSRFPLEGAHKKAPCGSCHFPLKLEDGSEFVQFKPLGTKCGDCHEISPTGRVR